MIDKKDIFMSGFKSKIGYSFTYKDLNEFETIIDFYEQQCKKQKEAIDKAIDKLYSIPIETTRQEVIDIARETLHILKEVSE